MKQQIIELKKKLLLVELPEGANRLLVFDDDRPYLSYYIRIKTFRFYFPIGHWQLIGKLTDITESQFAELVDKFNADTDNFFLSAKESFFSCIEKKGIVFENKLSDPELTMRQGDGSVYYGASEKDFEDYEQAESKVWDINRCWLFEIL